MTPIDVTLTAEGQALIDSTPAGQKIRLSYMGRDSSFNYTKLHDVSITIIKDETGKKVGIYFKLYIPGHSSTFTDATINAIDGTPVFKLENFNNSQMHVMRMYGYELIYAKYDGYHEVFDPGVQGRRQFASVKTVLDKMKVAEKATANAFPYLPNGYSLRNDRTSRTTKVARLVEYVDIYEDVDKYNTHKSSIYTHKFEYSNPLGGDAWIQYTTNYKDPANLSFVKRWTSDVIGKTFTSKATPIDTVEGVLTPMSYEDYFADISFRTTTESEGEIALVIATSFETYGMISSDHSPGSSGGCGLDSLSVVRGVGGSDRLFAIVHNYGMGPDSERTIIDVKDKVKWGNGGLGLTKEESGYDTAPLSSKGWNANPYGFRLTVHKESILVNGKESFRYTVHTSQLNTSAITGDLKIVIDIDPDDIVLGRYAHPSHVGFATNVSSVTTDTATFIDMGKLIVKTDGVSSTTNNYVKAAEICKMVVGGTVNVPNISWTPLQTSNKALNKDRFYFGLTNRQLWFPRVLPNNEIELKFLNQG